MSCSAVARTNRELSSAQIVRFVRHVALGKGQLCGLSWFRIETVIITPVLYTSQSYNDANEVIGMKRPRTGRAVCKGIMGNKDGKE